MERTLGVLAAAALVAGATGCAASRVKVASVPPPDAHVSIAADKPPSPATWPAYPRFSRHSCWARPFLNGEVPTVERKAPSYAPAPRSRPIPPVLVAKRLLARLGDSRYVNSIAFSPAPAAVGSRVHVLYAGGHPPADALQAQVVAPLANVSAESQHPTPDEHLVYGVAEWESGIVGGALRDDVCAAGGAPLVLWTGGIANSNFALEQRFPNPTPAAFRRRVALAGRRYGFRVVSLRLLRPEQLAPLLIVETSRKRKAFVKDVPKMMELLDPSSVTKTALAQTFEAFFFAAENTKGPFMFTQYVSRGEAEGGEWAANQCLYPYPVIGMLVRPGSKQKACA